MTGGRPDHPADRTAEVVLPGSPIAETQSFFEDLGFRIEMVMPADAPRVVVLSGHGLRLRLDRDSDAAAPTILLEGPGPAADTVTAPDGTRVVFSEYSVGFDLPPLRPALIVSRADDAVWSEGRAGMRYRDLVPDRQGGRFIASVISIPGGGPVPDYVHHHAVRFQMIYCLAGRVRVVYEDQGPPFWLEPGDCVLQPSGIRHRVLESSSGLEVLEIGCPAEHVTRADHDLPLPTSAVVPQHEFDGQRFVRHVATAAHRRPWRLDGFDSRDIGIETATDGLAGAHVARRIADVPAHTTSHDAEFHLVYVLEGRLRFETAETPPATLGAGDALVIPAGLHHRLSDASDDLELLEVLLPARPRYFSSD